MFILVATTKKILHYRKLRKSFILALQNRVDNHISLTKAKQIFYDTYQVLITDKKNKQTKEIPNII